nr:hypothetical protein [Tanacetum cinerariifolium]
MCIENKSKVRNSQNKSVVSQVKSSDANSNSYSEIAKLTHEVNQQTSVVTTAMTAIRKQFLATPPPASVKAVEEIYVTCGGAHPYYQCNSGYLPPGVANQIRLPGFAQPNMRNNQNRFGQPQGYNRGNNFNPEQSYQAPTQQNQVVPLSESEKVKRMNEANMKAMQTQINNVKNELRNEMKNSIQASMSNQTNELKNMMASFFQINNASTSGSGSLSSNTIANPKGELKSITTRSGIVLDGPFVLIPPPFINPEEDERVEETLTDQDLAEYTIKKLPEKLRDLGKFLISCGFSELKCKALADLADFFVVDYESDPRVPLILGRPFLRTARALIDVHEEEMILHLDSIKDLNPPHHVSTTSSSLNQLLEEFADELALITFLPGNDDLSFDIKSDLKEIEYLLHQDPIKDIDSILEDSIDQIESDIEYVYDDPFNSKGEKIKESKYLIDELDLPSDFLPPLKYDLFLSEDFS